MINLLVEKISDSRPLFALLVGVFTVASLLSIGLPLLEGDKLADRMKLVASERERIRAREREKLFNRNAGGLRQRSPKAYMKDIVDKFSLSKWLGTDEAKSQLTQAGFRGPQAEIAFLFFRLVTPAAMMVASALYAFVLLNNDWSLMLRLSVVLSFAYAGLKGPELYLSNTIAKRQ